MRASYIVPAAHVKNVCNLLLISDWDSWEGHWLTGRQSQHEDESIPWTKNHHPLWPIFSTARCKDYAKKCPKHVEMELNIPIPRENLDGTGISHTKLYESKKWEQDTFFVFSNVFSTEFSNATKTVEINSNFWIEQRVDNESAIVWWEAWNLNYNTRLLGGFGWFYCVMEIVTNSRESIIYDGIATYIPWNCPHNYYLFSPQSIYTTAIYCVFMCAYWAIIIPMLTLVNYKMTLI